MIANKQFQDFIKSKYRLDTEKSMIDEGLQEELDAIEEV